MCLRPRDRFWDIPVPKIDSAFDNLLVPQPSWSPSTTQQLRKLVAAPYLSPNDWTPRLDAYFASPLALCARRVSSAASRLLGSTSLRFALHGWQRMYRSFSLIFCSIFLSCSIWDCRTASSADSSRVAACCAFSCCLSSRAFSFWARICCSWSSTSRASLWALGSCSFSPVNKSLSSFSACCLSFSGCSGWLSSNASRSCPQLS
ncbi:hypothetical protein [Thiolapillus sp.]|uniref:hypothetical protein n=2 Tax=Thiolapillus sp. TaxID=2017437 RepID=UPI0025DF7FEB|nr:hypothetical protein [Thiolapillus sp.]